MAEEKLYKDYSEMTREELIQCCKDKDLLIYNCICSFRNEMLTKADIMQMYKCESDKALRILKVMFQMGYANKIGKEYYISRKEQEKFIDEMAGKEVAV